MNTTKLASLVLRIEKKMRSVLWPNFYVSQIIRNSTLATIDIDRTDTLSFWTLNYTQFQKKVASDCLKSANKKRWFSVIFHHSTFFIWSSNFSRKIKCVCLPLSFCWPSRLQPKPHAWGQTAKVSRRIWKKWKSVIISQFIKLSHLIQAVWRHWDFQ